MILDIFLVLLGLSAFNIILLIFSCNKDVKSIKKEDHIFAHSLKEKPTTIIKKEVKAKELASLPKESQLAATGS